MARIQMTNLMCLDESERGDGTWWRVEVVELQSPL